MFSGAPYWWLALPVLLLPLWWHRQRRQRLLAEPLATARFLPSDTPPQLRIWRWRERLLLLLRCLLLLAVIATLAATSLPWRGDTVLLDAGVDTHWAEQQIAAAGMGAAQRIALPHDSLQWLRRHERDWRASARLLIVARGSQLAMPAQIPQMRHRLDVRIAPPASPAASSSVLAHQVVLAGTAEHSAAWRSLFAAFEHAGDAASRYRLSAEPLSAPATTELIVWGGDSAPPAHWRAAHWWITTPAAFPELAGASQLRFNGLTLRYADSARGRLWSVPLPADANAARALYEAWQQLKPAPAPAYALSSQILAAAGTSAAASADDSPAPWLATLLLALFVLERIVSHARRH